MYTLEEIAALWQKLRKTLLVLTMFIAVSVILVGCTSQKSVVVPSDIKVTEAAMQSPLVVTDNAQELSKYDWAKHSNYFLFTLYLILLATACIYFKHTGKRSTELETSLKTMSTRLSPVSRLLSYVAKILGVIYCKKRKK